MVAAVLDAPIDDVLLRATLAAPARVQELERYDLTSNALRGRLDEIAARTAAYSGLPISLVTILGADRQLLLGAHGVESVLAAHPSAGALVADGTLPIAWAFCTPMVLTGHSHTETDLRDGAAHEGNPLVSRFGMRSYHGIPILSPDGQILGGHCLLHTQPHPLRLTDVLALEIGAAQIGAALAAHRQD